MPNFTLQIDLEPFEALDQLALLARQDYNLGGSGDWFGEFRRGLHGVYARLYGVQRRYSEVHAWLPRVRTPSETEYHLASVMFQMDSALECLTFALNAIGWVVLPADFRDITDVNALRLIGPRDIIGDPTSTPPTPPLQSGYEKVFPETQLGWQNQAQLIARIRDLHDVSKHRQTIYVGGKFITDDPPDGFFEALGFPAESDRKYYLLRPMAEIILQTDPKSPMAERTSNPGQQSELLEDLVPSFAALIDATGKFALGDAQSNVPLKEKRLQR